MSLHRPSSPRIGRTPEVIDELFAHPPVNLAEMNARLEQVHVAVARRLLVDRLEKGLVDGFQGMLLVSAFGHLGIGSQRGRLRRMLMDRRKPPLLRAFALSALIEDPSDDLDFYAGMDPGESLALAEAGLAGMLTAIQLNPGMVSTIGPALANLQPDDQSHILDTFERCRVNAGIPASLLYTHTLMQPELAHLHPVMLKAITNEADPTGIALLERLRDQATDEETHRLFQGAFLRACTWAIDTGKRPIQGHALLGTCDGQGTFLLLGCHLTPSLTSTLCIVSIQVDSGIRDGFCLTGQSTAEVSTFLDSISLQAGCRFTRIPLPVAARMTQEAIARMEELDMELPPALMPMACLLEDRTCQDDGPPPESPSLTETELASDEPDRLLAGADCDQSWFFDESDLRAAGVKAPPASGRGADSDAWTTRALKQLNRPEIRHRLGAMARHMARWHDWDSHPRDAGIWRMLADQVESDFVHAALPASMVSRTILVARGGVTRSVSGLWAHADHRQYLKALFFKHLDDPKGRDLAYLDFAEQAWSCLQTCMPLLPVSRRPRHDLVNEAAYAVATLFMDSFLTESTPLRRFQELLAEVLLRVWGLGRDESQPVVAVLAEHLLSFVDRICSRCPVGCLDHTDESLREAFFSPRHPAEGLL